MPSVAVRQFPTQFCIENKSEMNAPSHNYGTGIVRRSDLNKAAAAVTAELQQMASMQQQQDEVQQQQQQQQEPSQAANQEGNKKKRSLNQVAPAGSEGRKPSMSQRLANALGGGNKTSGKEENAKKASTASGKADKEEEKKAKEEAKDKVPQKQEQQPKSGDEGGKKVEDEKVDDKKVNGNDRKASNASSAKEDGAKKRESVMTEKEEEEKASSPAAEEAGEEGGNEGGAADEDGQVGGLSEKQMRAAFDLFDLDGSGEISASEFGTVVRSLGENPTDEEIEGMLKSVDRDMDGTLDFDEFTKLMKKRLEENFGRKEEELFREAFKVFDKDGSGKISRDELRKIVTGYGKMKLSESDADEMLEAADADGDGLINYEEFVRMFTDKRSVMAA